MTPGETTAYLAGIVDGEGSFIIYRKGGGRNPERKYHRAMLSVGNTDVPLVDFLAHELGGRINDAGPPKQVHHRRMFHVIVEGPKLAAVTERLLPFLLVKKRQAELVLEMLATMRAVPTGLVLEPEVLAERERIYEQYVEAKHGPARSWAGRKLA